MPGRRAPDRRPERAAPLRTVRRTGLAALVAALAAGSVVAPPQGMATTHRGHAKDGCAPYLTDAQARAVMRTPVKVVADIDATPLLITCSWGAASKSGKTYALHVTIQVVDPQTPAGRKGRSVLAATYCAHIEETCDLLGTLRRATTTAGVLIGVARIYQRLGGTVTEIDLGEGVRAIAVAAPPHLPGNTFLVWKTTLVSATCVNVRSFAVDMGCGKHALKVVHANLS